MIPSFCPTQTRRSHVSFTRVRELLGRVACVCVKPRITRKRIVIREALHIEFYTKQTRDSVARSHRCVHAHAHARALPNVGGSCAAGGSRSSRAARARSRRWATRLPSGTSDTLSSTRTASSSTQAAGDDAPAGALDVTGASVAAMDDGITFSVGTDSRKLTLRGCSGRLRRMGPFAACRPIPWTQDFCQLHRQPQPLGAGAKR